MLFLEFEKSQIQARVKKGLDEAKKKRTQAENDALKQKQTANLNDNARRVNGVKARKNHIEKARNKNEQQIQIIKRAVMQLNDDNKKVTIKALTNLLNCDNWFTTHNCKWYLTSVSRVLKRFNVKAKELINVDVNTLRYTPLASQIFNNKKSHRHR